MGDGVRHRALVSLQRTGVCPRSGWLGHGMQAAHLSSAPTRMLPALRRCAFTDARRPAMRRSGIAHRGGMVLFGKQVQQEIQVAGVEVVHGLGVRTMAL